MYKRILKWKTNKQHKQGKVTHLVIYKQGMHTHYHVHTFTI